MLRYYHHIHKHCDHCDPLHSFFGNDPMQGKLRSVKFFRKQLFVQLSRNTWRLREGKWIVKVHGIFEGW